jgi:hypothetical protein
VELGQELRNMKEFTQDFDPDLKVDPITLNPKPITHNP